MPTWKIDTNIRIYGMFFLGNYVWFVIDGDFTYVE